MRKLFSVLLSILLLCLSVIPVAAQEATPERPIYIVQSGDTLSLIAQRFGLSLDDLIKANLLADPNNLKVGEGLVIPGLEGVSGSLQSQPVAFGDTLASLSRRFGVPVAMLVKLNHLTSPAELYAGANLIIPQSGDEPPPVSQVSLAPGQTILELAAVNGVNPWTLIEDNRLSGSWEPTSGEPLFYPAQEDNEVEPALHPVVRAVEFESLPLVQGKTVVVRVESTEALTLSGILGEIPLNFFSEDGKTYYALQGIHAMAEPGLLPVRIRAEMADGRVFGLTQMVPVRAGGYVNDVPLSVPPETMKPENTAPENELWQTVSTPATPTRHWDGLFELPSRLFTREYCVDSAECWSSRFGSRRSYNGSAYTYFHTGLDIYGGTGIEIYAAAPGVVVFADQLTVRGGSTVIDHGWGVYSAYEHQSEILVSVGDRVETGQLIGKIGATGRVQGPHLHWEIIVGGVQVDPIDWLSRTYP